MFDKNSRILKCCNKPQMVVKTSKTTYLKFKLMRVKFLTMSKFEIVSESKILQLLTRI
jgi:hypothetical protein